MVDKVVDVGADGFPEDAGIVGQTITDARPMTDDELAALGWDRYPSTVAVVLVLEDGTTLYPSTDPEGNGPGALFGEAPDGTHFIELPDDGGDD